MADNPQAYRNTRDDQPFQFLGVTTLLRATADTTNGAFGLIEHPMLPPGFESPYHVHHREDESFYVLQGHVAFVCDGKWLTAGPGDFVFGPKNIPHGFKVTGTTPAQLLLLVSPGGFERFTQDLSEPVGTPPRRRTSQSSWRRRPTTGLTYSAHCLNKHPEVQPENVIGPVLLHDGLLVPLGNHRLQHFSRSDRMRGESPDANRTPTFASEGSVRSSSANSRTVNGGKSVGPFGIRASALPSRTSHLM